VGLVDDHDRAMPGEQVGERALELADRSLAHDFAQEGLRVEIRFGDALEIRLVARQASEMGLEAFLVGVDLPARGVADTQGLHGGHDYQRARAEVLRAELLAFVDIDHQQPVRWPVRQQRVVVRVAGHAQGIARLAADRVAGHQPQDHRCQCAHVVARRAFDGMRAQQGLATAGRNADADLRHLGCLAGERAVGDVPQPFAHRRTARLVEGKRQGFL
jgi:hypothetical protein